ncbi:MAG TPA: cytochrome c3 family protein [Geobacteraceae bacterium]
MGTGHPDGRPVPRTTSCGDCHADVVARYSKDYHARKAPCGGCHNPHRVYAPEEISGDEMNRVCSGCHRKHAITASHSRWLPQAELHLGAITCVTCHSKAENYVITIYIVKRPGRSVTARPAPATFAELKRVAGTDTVQTLIDRNRDGYISLNELRLFNRTAAYGELSLRGMLTPVKPTHSFQTFDNRWDCTFCHASGPETMQTSFVAFPERNGTYRQVAVEKGAVLDTLHTIPNFYLTGATRNDDLDKLGLLIIAGGLVMPVGHGFLRFLTRKNRR